MDSVKFKVETGIQLLARLIKKPEIENFYPILFNTGPKQGDVIELYSSNSTLYLLIDIISEALVIMKLNGNAGGVLIFNCDGNLHFETLVNIIRKKLSRAQCTSEELQSLLQEILSNIHILDIYDATQLYTTIHNLESILVEHSNISLVIFDTLTAFYWSEQGFKITKMDVYVKNLLQLIQKITREYKITILYTRPEYFSSSKDLIENLEACCEQSTLERVNYRIQMVISDTGSYQVNIKTFSNLHKVFFNLCDDELKWL